MEIPFRLKKSLSQNFLTNTHVPEKMADAARVSEGDTVLEIGPGAGALTRTLLERGAKVIAVEADLRAIASLRDTFGTEMEAGRLTVHHGDIRGVSLETLDLPCTQYKVVANIPYHLSGILFRLLLSSACHPSTLVFLIQKEVAVRIASLPHPRQQQTRDAKESLLSLSVKAYGMPTYIDTVGRNNFKPQPRVDSAIIAISDITKNRFTELDETFFFEILHLGFGQKRKQLLGNLSKRFSREKLREIFSLLHIREDVRAEDLSIDTWISLGIALQKA